MEERKKKALVAGGAVAGGLGLVFILASKAGAVQPPDGGGDSPFGMVITNIQEERDKFASAYRQFQVTAEISNPYSYNVTHLIRTIVAKAPADQEDISAYRWTRYWSDGSEEMQVALAPGESLQVISPFYYIRDSFECSNIPLGMYHGGVPCKYYFRIIDEKDYWSPVASIGTYGG
jgi:hypothetical protein